MGHSLVWELHPNDVVSGRGVAISSFVGNVRFRELIQSRRVEYNGTARHKIKKTIGNEIYQEIRRRNGRFVRKIESAEEINNLGIPFGTNAWTIVDESTALTKIKQALRESTASKNCTETATSTTSRVVDDESIAISMIEQALQEITESRKGMSEELASEKPRATGSSGATAKVVNLLHKASEATNHTSRSSVPRGNASLGASNNPKASAAYFCPSVQPAKVDYTKQFQPTLSKQMPECSIFPLETFDKCVTQESFATNEATLLPNGVDIPQSVQASPSTVLGHLASMRSTLSKACNEAAWSECSTSTQGVEHIQPGDSETSAVHFCSDAKSTSPLGGAVGNDFNIARFPCQPPAVASVTGLHHSHALDGLYSLRSFEEIRSTGGAPIDASVAALLLHIGEDCPSEGKLEAIVQEAPSALTLHRDQRKNDRVDLTPTGDGRTFRDSQDQDDFTSGHQNAAAQNAMAEPLLCLPVELDGDPPVRETTSPKTGQKRHADSHYSAIMDLLQSDLTQHPASIPTFPFNHGHVPEETAPSNHGLLFEFLKSGDSRRSLAESRTAYKKPKH